MHGDCAQFARHPPAIRRYQAAPSSVVVLRERSDERAAVDFQVSMEPSANARSCKGWEGQQRTSVQWEQVKNRPACSASAMP